MASLGIWSKKGQLLVIGLDNAGKSTLLTMLVRSKVVQHEPTHQPVSDEIRVGSLKLRAVDMGGHAIARRMWREYSKEAAEISRDPPRQRRRRWPKLREASRGCTSLGGRRRLQLLTPPTAIALPRREIARDRPRWTEMRLRSRTALDLGSDLGCDLL